MKTKIVLALVAGLLAILPLAPAAIAGDVGPVPAAPATRKLTADQARIEAIDGWRVFVASGIPGHVKSGVAPCKGGPWVWRCNAVAVGSDTRCTARLVLWGHASTIYMQWVHLRCTEL